MESIPYFLGLTPAELESVRKRMFETKVDRGEIVSLEGEPVQALYFVASGAVKLVKTSPEGKEQIIALVRPGECFNDVAIFDGSPSPVTAQAMTPLVLYGIRQADMDNILREQAQVARNAVRVLAGRIRELMSLIEDLSFRPVIGRVARILVEHIAGDDGSRPRLTQQEMAALAGTAREMVGRSLKALEESRAIRMDRHRIIVTDQEALRQIAGLSVSGA